jgi:hypothetical protein
MQPWFKSQRDTYRDSVFRLKSSNDITLDATIKHINRRKHAVLFVISKAD